MSINAISVGRTASRYHTIGSVVTSHQRIARSSTSLHNTRGLAQASTAAVAQSHVDEDSKAGQAAQKPLHSFDTKNLAATAQGGMRTFNILQEDESKVDEEPLFWQGIPRWQSVSKKEFLSYQWQVKNTVETQTALLKFLESVLPETIPKSGKFKHIKTRTDYLLDVVEGMKKASMAVRLTPYVLSVIDWTNPLDDPIRRQFIPMKSQCVPDHPELVLDSLHEAHDSPVEGLVHRYPDKALFLAVSVCPVYCRYCTRSYAVGANTEEVEKASLKPSRKRWEKMFQYIESTPALTDIVVSGGDSFYLQPHHITEIGNRLLSMPNIRRIRFASKGLAVNPSRFVDDNDDWTSALIAVSRKGRELNKAVAFHTHFNHPNEVTWITRLAARKLYSHSVTVRNQTVLLKGVNDDVSTMKKLIRTLADNNIIPYYVYQGDMVQSVDDLRTPLSTILDLEREIRGSIAGFMMPNFVVDLPGGGGKRLAASYRSYVGGVSTFAAPAVTGRDKENKTYKYYDPVVIVDHNEHQGQARFGERAVAAGMQ